MSPIFTMLIFLIKIGVLLLLGLLELSIVSVLLMAFFLGRLEFLVDLSIVTALFLDRLEFLVDLATVIYVEPAVYVLFFCQLLFWQVLITFIIRGNNLPRSVLREHAARIPRNVWFARAYLKSKMRAALRRPAELAQAQERVLQLQLEVEQEDRRAFFFRDEAPHALDGNPMIRLTPVNNPLFHEVVNSVNDAIYGINRRHRHVASETTFERGPQFFNGGVPEDPFPDDV